MLTPWNKSYDQPRQHSKKQRHYFADKGPSSQGYGFSSSHVCMWELDHKERWVLKNWCLWTVVLEKTLESPLDWKEIQPVNPNGNQSWIFFGRTDAEAATPKLWPPDAKKWLIWKDLDAWKDWRWKEKGKAELEMGGWQSWTWLSDWTELNILQYLCRRKMDILCGLGCAKLCIPRIQNLPQFMWCTGFLFRIRIICFMMMMNLGGMWKWDYHEYILKRFNQQDWL